jgi:hypothetical protein
LSKNFNIAPSQANFQQANWCESTNKNDTKGQIDFIQGRLELTKDVESDDKARCNVCKGISWLFLT